MNYSSLPSAERFEKEGIGKDSEFVWVELSSGLWSSTKRSDYNKSKDFYEGCKIGPAMTSDEMEECLYQRDLFVVKSGPDCFDLEDSGGMMLEDLLSCSTGTEAREKAINWYLDQKEK